MAMCYPLSKLLSAIFTLFFFAIGAAFIRYGVNKSRKIGGWAVPIVFAGWPFFLVALWFLMEGVFDWDVRHVSTSCNRRSENIRVVPIVEGRLGRES